MLPTLAQSLADELNAAPYGGQGAILERWEAASGKSRSTLLRHAKLGGYEPQARKTRADAGVSRCGITDKGLSFVVALMTGSRRKTGSIEMPTNEAVLECIDYGVLPAGTKASTVRRLLREKGMSRRNIQTNYTTDGQTVSAQHIHLISEHPNHLHEVDASACIHWYFKKRGGLDKLDINLDLGGGKKVAPIRKIKNHIIRYVLVDHKTGAFYVRYYFAAGETALNLIDMLYNGWRRREGEQDIFHGAPRMVYFDKGSANLAHKVGNLLANLQIRWEAHRAGVARATGAAEIYQFIWQRTFESKLFLRPPENLEELNARADDYRIRYCTKRRMRKNRLTRWEAWSRIRGEQLRLLPPLETYQELVHERPVRTTVRSDGMVHCRGPHLITEPVDVGQRVEVVRNPYRLPEAIIYRVQADGTRGDLLSSQFIADESDVGVAVGTWKRRADTPVQTAMKAASTLDLSGFAQTVFEGNVETLPKNVRFLERQGQPIEPGPPQPPTDEKPQRPAWFKSGVDHYEWILKNPDLATPEDQAWSGQFEQTSEYQALSEYWSQLRGHLARQTA